MVAQTECQSRVIRGGSSHRPIAWYVETESDEGIHAGGQSSLEIQNPSELTEAFLHRDGSAWGVRAQWGEEVTTGTVSYCIRSES